MTGVASGSILPEQHEFSLSTTLAGVAVSLKCSTWRYPVSQGGVTLILTHGISGRKLKRPFTSSMFDLSLTDKEQYHTTITRLLSLRDLATYDIREIWTIDFPNHGEAATLNRRLLDGHKANSVRQRVDGNCSECLSWFIKIRRILGIH
jgi:hypothetical protein